MDVLLMPEYWLAFALVIGPMLVALVALMVVDLLSNKYQ